jgi:hypothetical protein
MTVERREAQRLSHQARMALARLCGGLDRKSSPKVPRKHLGASRRSTVRLRERGVYKARMH